MSKITHMTLESYEFEFINGWISIRDTGSGHKELVISLSNDSHIETFLSYDDIRTLRMTCDKILGVEHD